MEIKKMTVSDLQVAPYNPRIEITPGMDEYEKLKASIRTFDLVEPIVFNQQINHVVGGHQRLVVVKELGIEELDVSAIDLSLKREKVLNVALNKGTGLWDDKKLYMLLNDFSSDDIDLSGFSDYEVKELIATFETPNFDVGTEDEQGDLGVLIPHIIVCPHCGEMPSVQLKIDWAIHEAAKYACCILKDISTQDCR